MARNHHVPISSHPELIRSWKAPEGIDRYTIAVTQINREVCYRLATQNVITPANREMIVSVFDLFTRSTVEVEACEYALIFIAHEGDVCLEEQEHLVLVTKEVSARINAVRRAKASVAPVAPEAVLAPYQPKRKPALPMVASVGFRRSDLTIVCPAVDHDQVVGYTAELTKIRAIDMVVKRPGDRVGTENVTVKQLSGKGPVIFDMFRFFNGPNTKMVKGLHLLEVRTNNGEVYSDSPPQQKLIWLKPVDIASIQKRIASEERRRRASLTASTSATIPTSVSPTNTEMEANMAKSSARKEKLRVTDLRHERREGDGDVIIFTLPDKATGFMIEGSHVASGNIPWRGTQNRFPKPGPDNKVEVPIIALNLDPKVEVINGGYVFTVTPTNGKAEDFDSSGIAITIEAAFTPTAPPRTPVTAAAVEPPATVAPIEGGSMRDLGRSMDEAVVGDHGPESSSEEATPIIVPKPRILGIQRRYTKILIDRRVDQVEVGVINKAGEYVIGPKKVEMDDNTFLDGRLDELGTTAVPIVSGEHLQLLATAFIGENKSEAAKLNFVLNQEQILAMGAELGERQQPDRQTATVPADESTASSQQIQAQKPDRMAQALEMLAELPTVEGTAKLIAGGVTKVTQSVGVVNENVTSARKDIGGVSQQVGEVKDAVNNGNREVAGKLADLAGQVGSLKAQASGDGGNAGNTDNQPKSGPKESWRKKDTLAYLVLAFFALIVAYMVFKTPTVTVAVPATTSSSQKSTATEETKKDDSGLGALALRHDIEINRIREDMEAAKEKWSYEPVPEGRQSTPAPAPRAESAPAAGNAGGGVHQTVEIHQHFYGVREQSPAPAEVVTPPCKKSTWNPGMPVWPKETTCNEPQVQMEADYVDNQEYAQVLEVPVYREVPVYESGPYWGVDFEAGVEVGLGRGGRARSSGGYRFPHWARNSASAGGS